MKNILSRSMCVISIQVIVIILSSCTDNKELIRAELDTFPHPDSTLLYEYSAVSSSPTGDCIGTFLHRWYGTSTNIENVTNRFSTFLAENRWEIKPGEVVEIWSKENNEGFYRFNLTTFIHPSDISQEQGSYKLPVSVMNAFSQYSYVYLLHMGYMYSRAAEKCFGK